MRLPQVYADFNAIEHGASDKDLAAIPLTGYGTLSSLAAQGLRLSEGMRVLIYEPEDIECEALIHFDPSRTDPAGRSGEWVALVRPAEIRASALATEPPGVFPCLSCGRLFTQEERNYREVCSGCGLSVMQPMAPPLSAA
jgi:hypothetical protein